jgi:hypothetical protein
MGFGVQSAPEPAPEANAAQGAADDDVLGAASDGASADGASAC